MKKHNHNVEYFLNPIRSRYIDLVGQTPSDDILEIGRSMGQHAQLIVPRCRRLNALKVVRVQAEFSRVWCDGRSSEAPDAFHRRVLSKIWRARGPGGRLFFATKNCYAFNSETRTMDEYLGVRFGSALARWVQKRTKGHIKPGRMIGDLHSWSELKNHLRAVGSKVLDKLFAFPDARYPVFLADSRDFSLSSIAPEQKPRIGKCARILAALPSAVRLALANSGSFTAQKGMAR